MDHSACLTYAMRPRGARGNSRTARSDTPVVDDKIELGLGVEPELRLDSEPVP